MVVVSKFHHPHLVTIVEAKSNDSPVDIERDDNGCACALSLDTCLKKIQDEDRSSISSKWQRYRYRHGRIDVAFCGSESNRSERWSSNSMMNVLCPVWSRWSKEKKKLSINEWQRQNVLKRFSLSLFLSRFSLSWLLVSLSNHQPAVLVQLRLISSLKRNFQRLPTDEKKNERDQK